VQRFSRGPEAEQSRHRTAFPEWKVVDEEALDVTGAPGVKKADPCFYKLRNQ
jgi:hypothetical protein